MNLQVKNPARPRVGAGFKPAPTTNIKVNRPRGDPPLNLVLIGYRGTGKTEVSKLLGKRLSMGRVGMDEVLVERFGKSIPEFVRERGWDAFRDTESQLARELALSDRLVVDCGGGVVVREENVAALRERGRVVWLKATVPTIANRISGDSQRPSLTGGKSFLEEIEEVLARRLTLYEKASDYSVDTDSLGVSEVVEDVVAWWNRGH